MVTQSVTAEEREAGTRGAILGNNKVFMNKDSGGQPQAPTAAQELEDFEDMPF